MATTRQQNNAEYALRNARILHGNTIDIELAWPSKEEPQYIEVGLNHVRAADTVRISYDLDRDGYVIEQNTRPGIAGHPECWKEVAFVQAWALDSGEDYDDDVIEVD